MPERMLITLMFSLLLVGGGPAYAQGPAKDVQQAPPASEATPQPEAPKHISTIMVEDNRLSVEFVNVNFGEILRSISQKAGFQLEGTSPAFSKQVTTKFTDLDLDKGIVRLFSLVKETNYLVSYDAKGAVAKLKLPSTTTFGKTAVIGSPGGPQSPAMSPINRSRRSRRFQRPAPGAPAQATQPAPPQPAETEEEPDE